MTFNSINGMPCHGSGG